MSGRRDRRLAAALGASLLAHALAVALLFVLASPRVPDEGRPRSAPLQVELRPAPRSPAPVAPAPASPTPRPRTPARAQARAQAVAQALAPPLAPENAPGAVGATDEVVTESAPAAGAPTAGAGSSSGGTAPRSVALFDPRAIERALGIPGYGSGPGVGRGFGAAGAAGEGSGGAEAREAATVAGRIAGFGREANGGGRVEAGLVDPYFADLRRGMRRAFDPGSRDSEGGNGIGGRVADGVRTWLQAAATYAQSGSPYREGVAPADPHGAALRPAASPNFTPPASSALSRQLDWREGALGSVDVVALVELTQPVLGGADARVVQSSGRRDYDARAVAAVKDAARGGGRPPPPEPRNGDDPAVRTRTLWEIRTGFASAMPMQLAADPATGAPMAVFGYPVTFDETGTTEAEFGPDKRVVRVKLIALYVDRASDLYQQ